MTNGEASKGSMKSEHSQSRNCDSEKRNSGRHSARLWNLTCGCWNYLWEDSSRIKALGGAPVVVQREERLVCSCNTCYGVLVTTVTGFTKRK